MSCMLGAMLKIHRINADGVGLRVVTLWLLSCVLAGGRTHELREARSPDGRYRINVVEHGSPGRISCDIVSLRTGALLHRFPSSYQPDDLAENWAWEHAVDAEVSWSNDSRYVVIDEQVHRYIGRVLLAEVGNVTRTIPIPEKTLITRTQREWDRYRIRVREGWLSPREISLGLAGRIITGVLEDGRRTHKHVQFHFVLRIQGTKAIITRLDAAEDF
jgi:hypothetical protein